MASVRSNLDKLSQDKVRSAIDQKYEWICSGDGAFGRWISGLWGSYGLSSLDEMTEAFFILLERLLRENNAVLFPPWAIADNEPVRFVKGVTGGANISKAIQKRVPKSAMNGEYYPFAVWDIPIEEQILYVRRTFPRDATHANDIKITNYFYSTACPFIGWVDPATGKIVAS